MPVVALNGVPLIGAETIRWGFQSGINPVVGTFHIQPQDIATLAKKTERHTAVLSIDGIAWGGLSIVDFPPGPNPFIGAVMVVDRRFWWSYEWVGPRRFNMRRNAGFKRRGKWNAALQQEAVREVLFAKFSLKDRKTVWTPKEAFLQVVTDVDPKATVINDGFIDQTLQTLSLDNFVIDDSGHNAIQKVIEIIPGASLYIDRKGQVVLYSTASGGEFQMIDLGGPEIVQGGHVAFDTAELVRPSSIFVYFTIESELRVDHVENQATDTVAGERFPQRTAENVLPVPDFSINMTEPDADGKLVTKEITQGTWKSFNEYLRAIVNLNLGRGLLEDMTVVDWYDVMRKAFVPETNLWSSLFLAGSFDIEAGDKADWASRLSAFQNHYRVTYRLDEKLNDNILSLRPWTVGTIDVTSGQRSPAMLWSNYAVKNSFKFLIKDAKANGNDYASLSYARNVHAFDSFLIDDDARPSPAKIQVLDADQGVFRINYQLDPYKFGDLIFPSLIDGNEGMAKPSNAKLPGKPITFGSISRDGQTIPQLKKEHKFAAVMTAVPAVPNDRRQLYPVEIKPTDVKDRLPAAAAVGLSNAQGPPRHIRVSPGLVTALIRYTDNNSGEIDKIFGIGQQGGDPDPVDFTDLVLNDVDAPVAQVQGNAVAASLQEVAKAIAASLYASDKDRVQGQRTVGMDGGLTPSGNLDAVWSEVRSDGVLTSSMSLPGRIPALSIFSFMDQGTRQILQREVQSAKPAQ